MLGLGQVSLYKQVYSDDTLTEAWRAVIVDSLVLTVINRREIKPDDFQQSGRGPILTKGALARFLTRYDARVNETALLPGTSGRTTCRRAFELKATPTGTRHRRRADHL